MRNPNRTTKAERRAAKRWNALAARTFGVAEAARLMSAGVLLDEATGLDRLALAMLHDHLDGAGTLMIPASMAPPVDDLATWAKATASKVADVLTEHVLRPELERLGIDPAAYRYEYDAPAAAPVGAPDDMAELYSRAETARKAYADKLWAETPGILPFDDDLKLYRGDPNKRDAVRAEAIENALADDFDEDGGASV